MGWCISQGKARGDMTVEERIGAADRRKMDGNALFKEEKLEEAMQQYEMVTHLVPSIYCFFAWVRVYVYIYIYIYSFSNQVLMIFPDVRPSHIWVTTSCSSCLGSTGTWL